MKGNPAVPGGPFDEKADAVGSLGRLTASTHFFRGGAGAVAVIGEPARVPVSMRPQQIRSSVPTAATSGNDPTGAVRIHPGRGEAFEFVEFE